eukprot:347715_1
MTEIETLQINPIIDSERHILYVKILQYSINSSGKRGHVNACIKMQLRDEMYKTIPGCIMMGCGAMAIPVDETKSVTYHAYTNPVIHETYRIILPNDIKKLETLHLYFSCWNIKLKNGKMDERGFAFINLYHDKLQQLINDNEYELQQWRNDTNSKNNYLQNDTLKLENNALVKIQFMLRSTKIYADIDIHRCLTWKHQKQETVIQSLKRVSRQAINQIMIIFNDLMDCMFSMMRQADNYIVIEMIYNVITNIFSEITKNINLKYEKRINEWIENKFKYKYIWRILSTQLLRLLQWVISDEAIQSQKKESSVKLKMTAAGNTRFLQKSLRAIKYILKLIKYSYIEDVKSSTNSDAEKMRIEYNKSINTLFDSLSAMMKQIQPKFIAGCQSFAIRNFEHILEIAIDENDGNRMQYFVQFINSYKFAGINNSVEMLLLIERYLDKIGNLQQIHLNSNLFSSLFKILHHQMEKHASSDQHVICFKLIKKCIPYLQQINTMNSTSFQELYDGFVIIMLRMFAILDEIRKTDLSHLMCGRKIFGKLIKKNTTIKGAKDQGLIMCDFIITLAELADVLNIDGKSIQATMKRQKNIDLDIEPILKCCNNLILNSLIPDNNWKLLRMIEVKFVLKIFVAFDHILQSDYFVQILFDNAWKQWLGLGMNLLAIKDLKLGNINDNYYDITNVVIVKLKDTWNKMTDEQISMLSNIIISGAIQVSSCSIKEVQDFIINAYFKVIQIEFKMFGNINSIKQITINQIDELTSKHSINDDEINLYLDFFRIGIKNKLQNDANNDQKLENICNSFVSDVEALYNQLIQLNKIPNDKQHEDELTFSIINLLKYFDSSGKHQLYNRYIHKLGLMHKQFNNYVEAALCFQLHAERLSWSDIELLEEKTIKLPASKEWKRHETLLELAQKHFLIGEYWETAIKIYQDLAKAYQYELFNLKSLSNALEKQSQLWKFIANQDRVFSNCYLVTFRGKFNNIYGDNVNNKSFIYRSGNGRHPETVRDFTYRIKDKYTTAIVKNSSEQIEAKYNDEKFNGQFIQITTLNPSSKEEFNDNSEAINMLVYRYIFEQQSLLNLSYDIPDPIKYIITCFYPRDYGRGKSKWDKN